MPGRRRKDQNLCWSKRGWCGEVATSQLARVCQLAPNPLFRPLFCHIFGSYPDLCNDTMNAVQIEQPDNTSLVAASVDMIFFGGAMAGANNVSEAKPFAATMRDRILTQSQQAYAESETNSIPALFKSTRGSQRGDDLGRGI